MKDKDGVGKALPLKIVYTLLCALGCALFAVFCVYETEISFIQNNAFLFSLLFCTLAVVLFVIAVYGAYKGKEMLYKLLFTLLLGVLICLILLFVLLKTGFFTIVKDKESLANYLQKSGGWMPAVYVGLQYLQVVVLPIPSVVSTAVGVVLFGPFLTIIYSIIGILLGSFTAFFIGRKLGAKAVAWMIGKDTLATWQRKIKGKDNFILTLMFLLPMFPDDVLCFIAGLSTMSTKYFTVMIILARLFAITTTCYSITLIPFDTWWGLLIWGVLFGAILLAFYFIYKNMDAIQNKLSAWSKNKHNNK